MVAKGLVTTTVAPVLEDVLKKQGNRLNDIDLASRRAEETAMRRNAAAGWLRKMVGIVATRELPEEPSEEEFRLALRSGIILCNALNKVVPDAVPKVVEIPGDSVVFHNGAALSVYQYFENVRNFIFSLQEMGLPSFESSDLEQGGKNSRVVNCVLGLKSYHEWKQMGGIGSWRYGGVPLKSLSSGQHFVLKNSEPFMKSLLRSQSINDKLQEALSGEKNASEDFAIESSEMNASQSLNALISAILSDKKPDEIPEIVESLLSVVMEELENCILNQNDQVKAYVNDSPDCRPSSSKTLVDDSCSCCKTKFEMAEKVKDTILLKLSILDRQQTSIQELKCALQNTRAGMDYMKMQYSEEFGNIEKQMQALAHAASGYHKVLEENRKLYNQVQDLKGNIRVYCRVRPFLPGQTNKLTTVGQIDDGTITIMIPTKFGKEGRKSFTFNKVFGPYSSQGEVFEATHPLIRSVLDGYNVCIFSYGQTGSGKTFTMSGPRDVSEQNCGVNYRALRDLFSLSEQRKDTVHYEISIQMIEIYNEHVRDLLVTDGLNRRLEIRNSTRNGFNVPDASLVQVLSTSEVIEFMNIGQQNRAVGATALNDRSSRSHSCLTVHVQGKDLATGAILQGCMHLVDLAGSERVDKSEVKGDRLKEAQHINKSLSALGDVIASLANKNSHVPYRNSKLTQLLQDSLGGQAKTLMFVHISPEADAIGETISTLKFAERVSAVELGAARLNKESNEVRELKEQITSLKADLARKEGERDCLLSVTPSPDISRSKTSKSSVRSNGNGEVHVLGSLNTCRQPMEKVGNTGIRRNPMTKQKITNFDLQHLLMSEDSPQCPSSNKPKRNFKNVDDRGDLGTRERVDNKNMLNKHQQDCISDDDALRDWEGDGRNLAGLLYGRCLTDAQLCLSNGLWKPNHHDRFDTATTDDSDYLDMATSDSSEADLRWQFNFPNANCLPNNSTSKIKKPQAKFIKSSDMRSSSHSHIPSPIPSPSRKAFNGSPGTPLRKGRLLSFDGKRVSSIGKTGASK